MALSQRRIGWLLAVFALLLAVAAGRALQLTTVSAGRLSSLANAEHVATITLPAPRGSIVDRNGDLLAVDQAADDITATPKQVRDPAAAALKLAPLLGVPVATLEADITNPIAPDWTRLARQVPAATARKILKLGIAGIALTPDARRVYPGDTLAAQVLGGVGWNGGGLSGIELRYNQELSGVAGHQSVVYDGQGQPIHVTGPGAVAGKTVQLTIDAPLQQYTDSVVAQTGEAFHALHATAIVLDPRTGAIYAMSSWPRVSANDSAAVGLAENYADQLIYEPGSTFKVVAIGGALSEGIVSPDTKFTIPPCIQVANYCITDSETHGTEVLSTSQILAHSSNIGAIEIGEKLGDQGLYEWIRRFGFGTPTGVDLPGEEPGLVPAVANWSGSTIGNLPIGQGVSVTPLQIATAYAAIADGGVLRPPHIVSRVGGVAVALPKGQRILTPQVADQLRGMLEGVLGPSGTAAEISIPGYSLAGKTGTANKVVNGTYSHKDYVASFVGFAPASNPQLEAIVVVDQPQGPEFYGTEVAAPAWQKIMDFALPYLKIAPG